MVELNQQACEVCRADTPRIGEDELPRLMLEIPHWSAVVVDDVTQLSREYKFGNFAEAMAFSNRVGEIAEVEDHHPAILTEWGKVTITWWTHTIRGLHINDLIMAARTDLAYAG
jgi:4a-hydroxytetrahydrobiopterin dehydratase